MSVCCATFSDSKYEIWSDNYCVNFSNFLTIRAGILACGVGPMIESAPSPTKVEGGKANGSLFGLPRFFFNIVSSVQGQDLKLRLRTYIRHVYFLTKCVNTRNVQKAYVLFDKMHDRKHAGADATTWWVGCAGVMHGTIAACKGDNAGSCYWGWHRWSYMRELLETSDNVGAGLHWHWAIAWEATTGDDDARAMRGSCWGRETYLFAYIFYFLSFL